RGSAIFFGAAGTFSVNRTFLRGNRAGHSLGGAITVDAFDPLSLAINDSLLIQNRAATGGGILLMDRGGALTVNITHSALLGNLAVTRPSYGFLFGNNVNEGGGIFVGTTVPGAHLTLVNTTLSANRALAAGGGVAVHGTSADLTNTVLWGNHSSLAADLLQDSGDSAVNGGHSDLAAPPTL